MATVRSAVTTVIFETATRGVEHQPINLFLETMTHVLLEPICARLSDALYEQTFSSLVQLLLTYGELSARGICYGLSVFKDSHRIQHVNVCRYFERFVVLDQYEGVAAKLLESEDEKIRAEVERWVGKTFPWQQELIAEVGEDILAMIAGVVDIQDDRDGQDYVYASEEFIHYENIMKGWAWQVKELLLLCLVLNMNRTGTAEEQHDQEMVAIEVLRIIVGWYSTGL
ncbi:hypothetical protein GUITHDRAFT_110642 [Guillardia theta CCMP2712]|uniref:Uncharacterized protein n=2 Tax=Guillardia theta TaxID=55529 RepID=L1J563_GUITC|nr:hypothetical protein GUITHDRAFT_110642 [Guillardia theta CCMP2712]EKX43225.1 hypothetical protein GUITHDRAFT_110642 [Guillardia theta CCMP2712]|eukprot:XP_005830205.1 hypothetical protein GUITHDRAFT_110642 [Guillardia theta CCMP2712]